MGYFRGLGEAHAGTVCKISVLVSAAGVASGRDSPYCWLSDFSTCNLGLCRLSWSTSANLLMHRSDSSVSNSRTKGIATPLQRSS